VWKGTSGGEVISFSGCDDNQTSADTDVKFWASVYHSSKILWYLRSELMFYVDRLYQGSLQLVQ